MSLSTIVFPLVQKVSLVAQLVKNLPAMQETWVQSLGWKDPLEKGKTTHSIFWPGEFHGLHSPWGRKESEMTEQLSLSLFRISSRGLISPGEEIGDL